MELHYLSATSALSKFKNEPKPLCGFLEFPHHILRFLQPDHMQKSASTHVGTFITGKIQEGRTFL